MPRRDRFHRQQSGFRLRLQRSVPARPHRQGDAIQNNATWTRGNHTILFGGEFDYQKSPNIFLPLYNGEYLYSDFSSFLQDSGALLLANGNPVIPFTEPDAAGYVQDDWKMKPNFTLHIGLRWEYFGQAVNKLHDETLSRESNPATAFWDPSLPLTDRTVGSVNDRYKNFEPRLGFAWNPSFDKDLVVNGGYAISANPAFYNIFLLDAIASPVANTGVVGCSGNCLPGNGSLTGAMSVPPTSPACPLAAIRASAIRPTSRQPSAPPTCRPGPSPFSIRSAMPPSADPLRRLQDHSGLSVR